MTKATQLLGPVAAFLAIWLTVLMGWAPVTLPEPLQLVWPTVRRSQAAVR